VGLRDAVNADARDGMGRLLNVKQDCGAEGSLSSLHGRIHGVSAQGMRAQRMTRALRR
jgi:hypothetical protein